MFTSSGSFDHGRFDELAEEFAERYRRGERPMLQEYVDRLPEMADEIRRMFPALVEVEEVERDARDDAHLPPAVARHRELGDYRIIREIGRGGMGVVYEAEQVSPGPPGGAEGPAHPAWRATARRCERFRREAKAAARLHHTNIVPVFEVGRDGGVAYYAMQFIQGQGLDQVIGELARLRDHGRKDGAVSPGRTVAAEAVGPGEPTLGRVAELLLSGRLATEGAVPRPKGTLAPARLAATEQLARTRPRTAPQRVPARTASCWTRPLIC